MFSQQKPDSFVVLYPGILRLSILDVINILLFSSLHKAVDVLSELVDISNPIVTKTAGNNFDFHRNELVN